MCGELDPVKLITKLLSVKSCRERSFLGCSDTFSYVKHHRAQSGEGGMRHRETSAKGPLGKNKALAISSPYTLKKMEKDFPFFFYYFFALEVIHKSWDCQGQGRNSE